MDVERTDGERTDVERTDGERTDGERTDVEHTDVEHTDVEHTDVERMADGRTDVEHTDVERMADGRTGVGRTDSGAATVGDAAASGDVGVCLRCGMVQVAGDAGPDPLAPADDRDGSQDHGVVVLELAGPEVIRAGAAPSEEPPDTPRRWCGPGTAVRALQARGVGVRRVIASPDGSTVVHAVPFEQGAPPGAFASLPDLAAEVDRARRAAARPRV